MSGPTFSDVRRYDTLESTNTFLLDQARLGVPEGVVVVADHQSAGRGRLGRRWEAPPGACLLASVLLRPVLDPADLHLCTAAVALAAADACGSVAGVVPALKWPNDLLVGGRKLAGVLAESDPGAPGGARGSVAVVVGVGVNVDWPGPDGAGGTCLSDAAGRRVDRDGLLTAWLDALVPRTADLGSPGGRTALARELRDRCDTVGRSVRVTLVGDPADPAGRRSITGLAVDVTPEGHLVIETGSGRRHVAAGDVVHLRPEGDDATLK